MSKRSSVVPINPIDTSRRPGIQFSGLRKDDLQDLSPLTPMSVDLDEADTSIRTRMEVSGLLEDDIHSSFESIALMTLSPLTPLPQDFDDEIESLSLSSGM
jgi:hypothetical protein